MKKFIHLSILCTLAALFMGLTPPMKLNDFDRFTENEKNTIQVFSQAVKSVVNVTNIKLARSPWAYGNKEIPQGAGSGFIWDEQGHIVTNFHVVAGGDAFLITFHQDKKQYKAEFVGGEPKQDIAVLKLVEKPEKLHAIRIGSSQDLMVGQKAMAIGNPFGLDNTITQGIVSALDRKIPGFGDVKIHGMIQTDTSINPGNSGGPLLNSLGDVIGMNTIIFSGSGTSAGVGFAVPVDSIKRIVPQLIQFGKIVRPGLGIGVLPEDVKAKFGVQDGVVITYMDEEGPAAKAGMVGIGRDRFGRYFIGDIILAIDGKNINNYDDIYYVMDSYKIGDEVEVTYKRNEKVKKVKLKLTKI